MEQWKGIWSQYNLDITATILFEISVECFHVSTNVMDNGMDYRNWTKKNTDFWEITRNYISAYANQDGEMRE